MPGPPGPQGPSWPEQPPGGPSRTVHGLVDAVEPADVLLTFPGTCVESISPTTVPQTTLAPTTTVTGGSGGQLPSVGSDSSPALAIGALLVLAGASAVVVSWRRRPTSA